MITRARLWSYAPILLVLIGAALLRLTHLGYSHFQGDEIKAQLPAGALVGDYLLSQKKGPGQFLVTGAVQMIIGSYGELPTRLPFAVASLIAVLLMFLLVRREWGHRAGMLAAALVAGCGLIVAFGRIVQYQAFCMLFVLWAAQSAFTFAASGGLAPLYATAAAFGLGLLFHYDAATVAPTLGLLLFAGVRRFRREQPRLAAHVIGAAALAAAIAGVFYVPFVLQPAFTEVTSYLRDRVAAGRGVGTFASTYTLLSLYLPPFYLVTIGMALLFGLMHLWQRNTLPSWALVVWFLTTFAFYMLLGGDPRSHVYNYILPGLMIAACGLSHLVDIAGRVGLTRLASAAVWTMLLAFGGVTWGMLVDHHVEHPWYAKRMLGYTLPNLETRHVEGVFGFPYRRGLEQVGVLFDTGVLTGTFDSNERDVMADFYFRTRRGSPADYYLFVHEPLSLDRDLPERVSREYEWIRGITINGRTTIDIYQAVR